MVPPGSGEPPLSSAFGPPVLITNIRSPHGRADLEATEQQLRTRSVAFRSELVTSAGDATEAARRALAAGERFLVAVGGDDLVHAVVNGMLDEGRPVAPGAVLGMVAGAAPNDVIRTFGLPADPDRACRHLEGQGAFAIDAVMVRYSARDGTPGIRHFLNVAEAGLGGAIVARTALLPARLGRVRRFAGFWLAEIPYRPCGVVLRGDRRTWEGRATNVLVANGQYAGDGYRLSPRSWPSDGYVDVLVMTGPKSDAYTLLPKAILGEHLPNPHIVEYRSRTLSIESQRPLLLHADGQPLGTTPARFEVVPEAIRVKL